MTLTEVLPTLRRSIPSPLRTPFWPEHTVSSTIDVIIGGVSLVRLTEIGGTPALLTGDLPHPHARAAREHGVGMDVTVLIFRITLRVDTLENKRIALTDCSLDGVDVRWDECRLIGRASTAKHVPIELVPGEGGAGGESCWPHPVVTVPGDLHEGDVLAAPCIGVTTLAHVRSRCHDAQVAAAPAEELTVGASR